MHSFPSASSASAEPPAAGTAALPRPSPDAPSTDAVPARAPERELGLDVLRVVAICGVVAIHIFGHIMGKQDLRGNLGWWIATAIDIGAIWAVPAFIMISGAFALDPRAHRDGPAAFYRKRFARILPAMIFWHLVYLVIVRVFMRDEQLSVVGVTMMVIDAKVFTGLYFLWLIAGLYVLAPVLAPFLHAGGRYRALVTAAVALGWTLVAYMIPAFTSLFMGQDRPNILTSWNRWWPYVGFFIAGWALRKTVLSRRWTIAALVGAALLLAEAIWQYGGNPPRVLHALSPVMATGTVVAAATLLLFMAAVSIGSRMAPPEWATRILSRLSEAAFGVFLIHLLVYEALKLVNPEVGVGRSLPVVTVTYVVVLVISFAASMVANRTPYLRKVF